MPETAIAPDMLHPEEIAPGVYQLKVIMPNNPLRFLLAYLVKGPSGCTLIDAGWNAPIAFESLERQLNELLVDWSDITQIVITHLHPDHYGLAGRVKELSGACIIMHEREAELIHLRYRDYVILMEEIGRFLGCHGVPQGELSDLQQASMPVLHLVLPVEPDRTVRDGELIEAGSRSLQAILAPGHSLGQICLYDSVDHLLFSGDHILPTITPSIGLNPQSSPNPLGEYLDSLARMMDLDVRLVLPAHEGVFRSFRERIRQLEVHHEQRSEEILEALAAEGSPAYDVAQRITWSIGPYKALSVLDRRLAVMEALAHLEYLANLGRLARVVNKGVVVFRCT